MKSNILTIGKDFIITKNEYPKLDEVISRKTFPREIYKQQLPLTAQYNNKQNEFLVEISKITNGFPLVDDLGVSQDQQIIILFSPDTYSQDTKRYNDFREEFQLQEKDQVIISGKLIAEAGRLFYKEPEEISYYSIIEDVNFIYPHKDPKKKYDLKDIESFYGKNINPIILTPEEDIGYSKSGILYKNNYYKISNYSNDNVTLTEYAWDIIPEGYHKRNLSISPNLLIDLLNTSKLISIGTKKEIIDFHLKNASSIESRLKKAIEQNNKEETYEYLSQLVKYTNSPYNNYMDNDFAKRYLEYTQSQSPKKPVKNPLTRKDFPKKIENQSSFLSIIPENVDLLFSVKITGFKAGFVMDSRKISESILLLDESDRSNTKYYDIEDPNWHKNQYYNPAEKWEYIFKKLQLNEGDEIVISAKVRYNDQENVFYKDEPPWWNAEIYDVKLIKPSFDESELPKSVKIESEEVKELFEYKEGDYVELSDPSQITNGKGLIMHIQSTNIKDLKVLSINFPHLSRIKSAVSYGSEDSNRIESNNPHLKLLIRVDPDKLHALYKKWHELYADGFSEDDYSVFEDYLNFGIEISEQSPKDKELQSFKKEIYQTIEELKTLPNKDSKGINSFWQFNRALDDRYYQILYQNVTIPYRNEKLEIIEEILLNDFQVKIEKITEEEWRSISREKPTLTKTTEQLYNDFLNSLKNINEIETINDSRFVSSSNTTEKTWRLFFSQWNHLYKIGINVIRGDAYPIRIDYNFIIKKKLTKEANTKLKQDFQEIINSEMLESEKRKKLNELMNEYEIPEQFGKFLNNWIESKFPVLTNEFCIEEKIFNDIIMKFALKHRKNYEMIMQINKEGIIIEDENWYGNISSHIFISADHFNVYHIKTPQLIKLDSQFYSIITKYPYSFISFKSDNKSLTISNQKHADEDRFIDLDIEIKLEKLEKLTPINTIETLKNQYKSFQFVELDKDLLTQYQFKNNPFPYNQMENNQCEISLLSPENQFLSFVYAEDYTKKTDLKLNKEQYNYSKPITKKYESQDIDFLINIIEKIKYQKIRIYQNEKIEFGVIDIEVYPRFNMVLFVPEFKPIKEEGDED